MALAAAFEKYTLRFRFDAGTSRGVLRLRDTYFLKIWDGQKPEFKGVGEAGPLPGLSPDYAVVEQELKRLCDQLPDYEVPTTNKSVNDLLDLVPSTAPSVRFALELALKDLINGGRGLLYQGPFTNGTYTVPINGLVWMGSFQFMKDQVDQKIKDGYRCIKVKIGAIDFDKECGLLKYIRETYGTRISIRADANGAFGKGDVFKKLERLAEFSLHSLEQPVKPGQIDLMKGLCTFQSVPIALDEELIGHNSLPEQQAILDSISPRFIVLKPTLVGGLAATERWIRLAEERGIGWWITSALESNVGLNGLAQFTAGFSPSLPQGLGTGLLFHNNTASKLSIRNGRLHYHP
ncbi:MAG: o-succinylbenzoate synthase [Cyclobacteriaceae bacterium]|nr:MAG: o-succinylbenzoate synthase [Cyclobacteriaceae bacterium]